jgi:hypothetical protein
MKSKSALKSIEKAIKRSRIDMKRAKARDDQAMYLHHQARYKALGGN